MFCRYRKRSVTFRANWPFVREKCFQCSVFLKDSRLFFTLCRDHIVYIYIYIFSPQVDVKDVKM